MSLAWPRPIAAIVASAALLAPLALVAQSATAAVVTPSVVINEVESSDPNKLPDWIELKNTGATSVDLSNYILRDNVDTDAVVIPAGTTIAAGDYLAVDVDVTGGYGLGGSDSARLFMPDGATLVDSYVWTAHAAVTYGRCPDGTGAFTNTLAATKGAANSCAPTATVVNSLVINEVESSDPAKLPDWIEIKNNATVALDASGLILRDNVDTDAVVIPANSIIAAGGYLAVDVDVTGGYGLGGSDSARLYTADGATLIDSYVWTAHAKVTYGRCPDGTGAFIDTYAATKGAANSCTAPSSAVTSVVINEVESSDPAKLPDWIELKNKATTAVDVSGLILRDNVDTDAVVIPANTTIAAGGYLAVDVDVTGGYGLGGSDSARLYTADGATLIDTYTWTAHAAVTYGRCPDGTGAFADTVTATKGAANDCAVAATPVVKINEVESTDGIPGDWTELFNPGTTAVDLTGWTFRDNDDTHTYALPSGASIAAGGYYVIEEAAQVWGLGSADSVRLYAPGDTTTPEDSYTWTTPAVNTTYGRCPNGTGAFTTTTTITKGAANDCTVVVPKTVVVNEVESSDGGNADWIELMNVTSAPIDASGYILKDSDDTHSQALPAGSTIAAGGFLAVDTTFGLGDADSARVFAADGTTLLDSYSWTVPATTTYGRSPDGTGTFTTTYPSTKGAANKFGDTWPGGTTVKTVDDANLTASNLSGLDYEGASATGPIWAVQNGPGTLYRLVKNDAGGWVSDTTNGFTAGKVLHYADGTGDVDAEGVTITDAGASAGVYVSSERNNTPGTVSRPSVLKYDVSGSTTSVSATTEWNLASDLPVLGANLGLEAITWVPDTALVAQGFVDEHTGALYDPATYADHGSGLFFVGVEQNGLIYAYALKGDGTFTRVASFSSGFVAVMDLQYDPETSSIWAACDDTCNGRIGILDIASTGATAGHFGVTDVYQRPAGMPNYNNEGFALAPQALCVDGSKPAFWSDDTDDGGYSLREGTVDCDSLLTATPVPTISGAGAVDATLTAVAGSWTPAPVALTYQWSSNGTSITGATAATITPAASDLGAAITVTVTGTKANYTTVSKTSNDVTIAPAVLASTTTPTILGSGVFGDSLTAVPGGWSADAVSYQWLRDGIGISGATSTTFSPSAGDVGAAITVSVTGTKPGYTTVTKTSNATTITPASLTAAPVPSIGGNLVVGDTLTATAGAWAPVPVALSYQWSRNGVDIPGAVGVQYRLAKADAATHITVRVTGTREGFTSLVRTSAATAAVKATFTDTSHVVIRGTAKVGKKLTAATGSWSPKPKFTYRWYANGKAISGATHSTYKVTKSVTGKKITVKLTATKAGYLTVVKTSANSSKVK